MCVSEGGLTTGCSGRTAARTAAEPESLGATRGYMYTARCTRKVLQALHLPATTQDRPPSTALGDWYVNFIHTRNHRLVHFLSDRALLSVIVPVKTLKTSLDRHIADARPP